mmetsp:Transcript_38128/g.65375  ORF Transcript_38128/g.65375 Transcript_38128/m.65375 type:complete len:752 (-) Transcript_38128:39-2294(-)
MSFLLSRSRVGLGNLFQRSFQQYSNPFTAYSKFGFRGYSTDAERLKVLRNIGISAHIDSGKTTLTERILFYTGRISQIHEVRGKDGVGAKMDSMELEREKGITIKSAATFSSYKNHHINIIDTPGHVDFTIEVERALRVLDGAVLVVCSVGGVQSQTMTVDRQMKRYKVPRIVFINKLDRAGADPLKVTEELSEKLQQDFHLIQLPIGLEEFHAGVVDLVSMKALLNEGEFGEKVREADIPEEMLEQAKEKRSELLTKLADFNDEIGMGLMEDENYDPPTELVRKALRDAVIARRIIPVMMGSAYKNKGVQQLLDGVLAYLPNPTEVHNEAIDVHTQEKVPIKSNSDLPVVALAFKLEENKYGQLTYMRVYQGTLRRGDTIFNVNLKQRMKVPRLIRMHSDEMEDVQEIGAGEICAMFGVDCYSGDTFTDGNLLCTMTSMHVPEPVISLSIKPEKKSDANFTKALTRFQKEDPTFRVTFDPEANETLISGMGELHLDIYIERIKREYGVSVITGRPKVAFRETPTTSAKYEYTHKKQSGGRGQYAKMIGEIEPIRIGNEGDEDFAFSLDRVFEDITHGGSIPPEFIPACKKGFEDVIDEGPLIGHPVVGCKMIVSDGGYHAVDSSEIAFRLCAKYAFRKGMLNADPAILEPVMRVEVTCPAEFQNVIIPQLTRRKAIIDDSVLTGEMFEVVAQVPLNNMFGYSTELRSATQGKGEFSMEYSCYQRVSTETQNQLIAKYQEEQAEQKKKEGK